ncbi:hypothetical protein SBA2_40043 [Acidobacteriia bacterium SbA2]|nr:hypothetical protein SBA2_40043 [Acidobacteriia bacterium SbA2]
MCGMSSIALISCGATRVPNLSREILNAIANRCARLDDFNFYEGEGDCTSERVAGQFSIFGAVEEKVRGIFRWRRRDEVTG